MVSVGEVCFSHLKIRNMLHFSYRVVKIKVWFASLTFKNPVNSIRDIGQLWGTCLICETLGVISSNMQKIIIKNPTFSEFCILHGSMLMPTVVLIQAVRTNTVGMCLLDLKS